MNARGALIIDPVTGDPTPAAGFVTDVTVPKRVTVRGNYTKGFRVLVGDMIRTRPYRDPAAAYDAADRLAAALERAN